MTKIAISPNVNGTGTFTIAAPNSNTDRTLTLPDAGGEVLTDTSDIEAQVKTATSATGAAPIFACRAWVNFNGSGAVAIRESGNVSSITDFGTGDYGVNFTTAMPDVNYAVASTLAFSTTSTTLVAALRVVQPSDKLTTSCRFYASFANQSVSGSFNSEEVSVAIFR